jgi:hypothetical protein
MQNASRGCQLLTPTGPGSAPTNNRFIAGLARAAYREDIERECFVSRRLRKRLMHWPRSTPITRDIADRLGEIGEAYFDAEQALERILNFALRARK